MKHGKVLAIEDIIYLYDTLAGSPGYDRSQFGIIDASAIEVINYKEKDFKTHAAYGKATAIVARKRPIKVGLVVSQPEVADLAKGMISIFSKSEIRWQRQVFDNLDDAYAWASGSDL